MDQGQDSLDHELQMALELSRCVDFAKFLRQIVFRKTYEEESKRRTADMDLILMEDPRVIEMNKQIDRIKQLYNGGGVQQAAPTRLVGFRSLDLCDPRRDIGRISHESHHPLLSIFVRLRRLKTTHSFDDVSPMITVYESCLQRPISVTSEATSARRAT